MLIEWIEGCWIKITDHPIGTGQSHPQTITSKGPGRSQQALDEFLEAKMSRRDLGVLMHPLFRMLPLFPVLPMLSTLRQDRRQQLEEAALLADWRFECRSAGFCSFEGLEVETDESCITLGFEITRTEALQWMLDHEYVAQSLAGPSGFDFEAGIEGVE
jgi:hypothetical protein